MSPCFHGGVCEAVEWNYQCNCANTDHYGPNCETGIKYNNSFTLIATNFRILKKFKP